VDGKQETREVVETKSRSLDRLIAIAGRPLSADRQRAETERILRLSHNPEEQRKIERKMQNSALPFSRWFMRRFSLNTLAKAATSSN
jgi:hypothetical protein